MVMRRDRTLQPLRSAEGHNNPWEPEHALQLLPYSQPQNGKASDVMTTTRTLESARIGSCWGQFDLPVVEVGEPVRFSCRRPGGRVDAVGLVVSIVDYEGLVLLSVRPHKSSEFPSGEEQIELTADECWV